MANPRSDLATAYLSLGSNLGDRLQFLKEAIRKIGRSEKVSVEKVSPIYETQPVGYEDQGWFLNLVVEIQTSLKPVPLLQFLLSIEDQMGRKRERKWGRRNIDLDILLYDERVVDSAQLTIPHPRMHERTFVLTPLAQIAPELLHPLLKKKVEELLQSCEDKSVVRLYSETI
ncbi:MAG: 2-amino-4-hydroxy-6-hydroxymethyldihydropteridine diphosphokinase [candidate division Zixibacteria bacterium]|nr:2-amino-4-hydroxy-6-hydroxymethyldihydropteridine diphosphokinase [candidate division Zixibacteria bacterium]